MQRRYSLDHKLFLFLASNLTSILMKFIKPIFSFFRNKYFLTGSFFIVWMLFFDRNDVFTLLERKKELKKLEESKAYFSKEIADNQKIVGDFKNSPAAIEKFAREKYLMKRENEDLFIVQKAEPQ